LPPSQKRSSGCTEPANIPSKNLLVMTKVCPSGFCAENDLGQVEIALDSCLECGTCQVLLEPTGEITWSYPRGGFCVLFMKSAGQRHHEIN
jgi:ferredoxin like protein